MNPDAIIMLVIMFAVAFLMIGIGISQIRSKKPTGFYTWEKILDEKEFTDVQAWNNKHGIMWFFYGVIIAITSLIGACMIGSVWCIVPFVGGVCLPLPVMIWYHHKLIALYRRNAQ